VAAERRWRARGERRRRQGGRGAEVGEVGGDAWTCVAAGGGARGPAPTVSGGGRADQRGKRRWQRKKKQAMSEGLVCNSQKVQGPLCKLRFPTATKVK
jgi:hypothetical protein